MPRAKRGNKRLEKRKKILALAKGYRGTKSKLYRSAKESVERALNFAYTGRKLKRQRPCLKPNQSLAPWPRISWLNCQRQILF